MSVIVTAASGQLGTLVVEALLARGASEIIATSRNTSALSTFAERGVDVAALDYTKPETVTAVVKPGDTLVLISGTELGQRAAQHSAVITAAKAAGVGRIIYTSAPNATTSALILAPEHKATEEFLVASGVPYTILRNGWYTENYVGQIANGREHGTITASVGHGRVASASRKDYAEAAAAAALDETLAGATLELSGDYAWDFNELAAAISQVIGTPVSFVSLSPEEHTASLTAVGLDAGTIGFIVGLDANIRDGLLGNTSGELAALIGRPTTPLAEGLAATLA
jgi:NAD(P)H dehydrogenase (quinone)